MTKNEESTRFYSDLQEKAVAKLLDGTQTSNSGAGKFRKGDVIVKDASLLCECKTVMSEKKSVSIQKEWILKNKEEAFSNRLDNHCVVINFGPNQENYFLIDAKLMKYLVDKLSEDYKKNLI